MEKSELESCPFCDVDTQVLCVECRGTGLVVIEPIIGPIYRITCICGFQETFVYESDPQRDLQLLTKAACPQCGQKITKELVGWGSDN